MIQISKRKDGEKGIITILTVSGMVFFVLPFVGLAIDSGVAYMAKARLQTAVDGAGIAAGRALSRGTDITAQQNSSTDTAKRFFHANFPDNWLATSPVPDPVVTFPSGSPKTMIVNVVATVQVPTYFLRILHWDNLSISATAQVSRRDVNAILVLDRSGSLADSGSCGAVQSGALTFVNSFVNGSDLLGMVTFGTDYRVDFPISTNFASGTPNLTTMLPNLVCYGYTNAAAAFWTAYQQLVTLNDTGALNVIVFFTDGMPNTITFGMNGATDNRLPVKKFATPLSNSSLGYDIKNASPCNASSGPFTGVVSFAAGIYKKDAASYPASQSVDAQKIDGTGGDAGGCAFDAQFSNSATIYKDHTNSFAIAGPGFPPIVDIAYLPDQDIFGNLTRLGYSGSPYATPNVYPATGGWPAAYQGKIRVDDMFFGNSGSACGSYPTFGGTIPAGCVLGISDSITKAGLNALDNAAQRARADANTRNLGLIVYTIGLGNAPGGVDNALLQRVANDPAANNYNTAYLPGTYLYAPDTSTLNQAFSQIASEVLRISK
jgi:Flp pilus assembly protein TadG